MFKLCLFSILYPCGFLHFFHASLVVLRSVLWGLHSKTIFKYLEYNFKLFYHYLQSFYFGLQQIQIARWFHLKIHFIRRIEMEYKNVHRNTCMLYQSIKYMSPTLWLGYYICSTDSSNLYKLSELPWTIFQKSIKIVI